MRTTPTANRAVATRSTTGNTAGPSRMDFPTTIQPTTPTPTCTICSLLTVATIPLAATSHSDTCGASCSEKQTLSNNGRGGVGGGYPGDSNWTTGSFTQGAWDVWSGRRGDIARAMFYMDLRYEGGLHGVTGVSEPDLRLTDDRNLIEASNTGANESIAYMGLLSVLLQWHQQDPVDLIEFQHNEAVASYQGNRNPFVDHPEWVACIYQDNCSGGGSDTTPPAAPTGLVAMAQGVVISLDWFDNGEADLAGYDVYRSELGGGVYARINALTLTASNFTDTTASSGSTNYYVVTAIDTSGNESNFSIEASAQLSAGGGSQVWINEFHYDDSGSDQREFVEIAGPAGTAVTGWSIQAYNGNGGGVYKTITLSGTIPDQSGCMGTLGYSFSGLQNGSPDGIALVDNNGEVQDFISYEGSLTASNGPAAGMQSNDIGVAENGSGSNRYSLQAGGNGSSASDFNWQNPLRATRGNPNRNQTLDGCSLDTTPPDAPMGLVISTGDGQLQLDWADNSDADLDGYRVYRSNQPTGAFQLISAGTILASQYLDTGLPNGSTQYYRVTALDQTGNESDPSSVVSGTPVAPVSETAWINELHYDNNGSDVGEFVELAGTAGLDLTGWSLVGYNGNGGGAYKTVALSGQIPDLSNGFGVLAFDFSGLQNGAPDGVALLDAEGELVEFVSYEGVFTASGGAADGVTADAMGVSETSSTPIGHSLMRTGNGSAATDFSWSGPAADSYGAVNSGQTFQ